MNKSKKKYSATEKQAYYMGLGAALAGGRFENIKKTMNSMSPNIKESYKNGLDDGYLKSTQKLKKYKGR